jgi:hypothetical protein
MRTLLRIVVPAALLVLFVDLEPRSAEAGAHDTPPSGCYATSKLGTVPAACFGTLRGFRGSAGRDDAAMFQNVYGATGVTGYFRAVANGLEFRCTWDPSTIGEPTWFLMMTNPDLYFVIQRSATTGACQLQHLAAWSYYLP